MAGCLHRSRHVCSSRATSTCNTGRFRDGCGEGDEEGDRQEHVFEEVVEVIQVFATMVLGSSYAHTLVTSRSCSQPSHPQIHPTG